MSNDMPRDSVLTEITLMAVVREPGREPKTFASATFCREVPKDDPVVKEEALSFLVRGAVVAGSRDIVSAVLDFYLGAEEARPSSTKRKADLDRKKKEEEAYRNRLYTREELLGTIRGLALTDDNAMASYISLLSVAERPLAWLLVPLARRTRILEILKYNGVEPGNV